MSHLEITIQTQPENTEILIALMSQFSFDSFVENEVGFLAYISADAFENESIIEELNQLQNSFQFSYETAEVPDKNWNEEWEKNFSPIEIGTKCRIRAPFHKEVGGFQQEVIVNPKMAFGTGHHATTYMVSEELFEIDFSNLRVLDMGCGTGVLAILAEKLGAMDIVAIDIDKWSYENTIENAELNNCMHIKTYEGDASLLEDHAGFDVVIANINRNILLNDIPSYLEKLKSGGRLLLSGFYKEDNSYFTDKANEWSLELINSNVREDWSMLHFIKR